MSHWNYRVIRSVSQVYNEDMYSVHEVYYDDNDNPVSCTVEPVEPYGETLQELKEDIERFNQALAKPVLEMSFFTKMTLEGN